MRPCLAAWGVILLLVTCAGPRPVAPEPKLTPGVWFVEVAEEDGTWLSPQDLELMGLDPRGASPPSLGLARGEHEIPYLAQRTGEGWGAFLFAPDQHTRTSERTAIRMDVSAPGPAMATAEQRPLGDEVLDGGLVTLRWEENQRYVPQAETETPWLWEALRTPSTGAITQTVVLPGALPGPVTVTLHLWSHTASAANPDHRLRLAWDGQLMDVWDWDGQGMQQLTTSFQGSTGEVHTLALQTPELPGAAVATVWLDRWEVMYRRRVTDDGSVWHAEGNAMAVEGARPGARLLDVTNPFGPRDLGPLAAGELVGVTPGHRYWVGVPQEAPSPVAVRAARALDLEALKDVAYLAIAPLSFHGAVEPLLEQRRSQGLKAVVVDPQAVYDTLGVGQPSADALHGLVAQLPSLAYVLLVGDGTVEPDGYRGDAGSLRVVTPFTRTAELGETPADSLLGLDRDGKARVAVGRLPASSVGDVTVMVDKTLQWEDGRAIERQPPMLLVRDDQAEFKRMVQQIETLLSPATTVRHIAAEKEGSRAELLAALGDGRAWVNYAGHGSLTMLSDDGLLTLEDGKRWRDPVLVVAWTCLAAHYAHPTQASMAEVWLRRPRGGAVAFLGPAGKTTSSEQMPILTAFYSALGEQERLGDAWLAALREEGSNDVRWGYVLLGDPALRLVFE